jgi:hypothetical protein
MIKRDASCPEAIGKFIKAHSRRPPGGCGGMLGGDDRGRGRHLAADPQAGRGTGSLTPYGPSQPSWPGIRYPGNLPHCVISPVPRTALITAAVTAASGSSPVLGRGSGRSREQRSRAGASMST